jgi:hypothetical protein
MPIRLLSTRKLNQVGHLKFSLAGCLRPKMIINTSPLSIDHRKRKINNTFLFENINYNLLICEAFCLTKPCA